MGKLRDLAAVSKAREGHFVYVPPDITFGAARILLHVELGSMQGPPVTVSVPVLKAVLRGLRRANPHGRIVITAGSHEDTGAASHFWAHRINDLLDSEMRVADAETLKMREYPNPLSQPARFGELRAPDYVGDHECRIVVGTLNPAADAAASGAIGALYGLLPRASYGDLRREPETVTDVYFSIGYLFHGAVVDLTHTPTDDGTPVGEVVSGDDLPAVDEVASKAAGQPAPDYVEDIRKLRTSLKEGAK